jgi:hypothetical protein
MIRIRPINGGKAACNSCGKTERVFSLIIRPGAKRDGGPGWHQTTWLCVRCLAELGSKVLTVFGWVLAKEKDSGQDES